jgi:hypothetical protein
MSTTNFYIISSFAHAYYMAHAVVQLIEALRYNPEGGAFISRLGHWNFALILSFRPHYGRGADSACNINDYQEYFLGD